VTTPSALLARLPVLLFGALMLFLAVRQSTRSRVEAS
jgi:hypothetical protein